MEKKRVKNKSHRPCSKLRLPSKRKKTCDNTLSETENRKLSNSESPHSNNKCPPNCSCNASNKPKYDFSDDSSGEEGTSKLSNESITPEKTENDLQWRGKTVQLKEMKIKLKRLNDGNVSNPTDDSVLSSDFFTCASSLSSCPMEYLTKENVRQGKDIASLDVPPEVDDTGKCTSNQGQSISQYLERNTQELRLNEHNDSPIQDNIMEAVQNKNGRKLMSEESEAFFWDWILQNE